MAFKFNFMLEDEKVVTDNKEVDSTNDVVKFHGNKDTKNSSFCSTSEAAHQERGESSSFVNSCKRHEVCLDQTFMNTPEHVIELKLQECGQSNPTLWYLNGKSVDFLLRGNAVSQNKHVLTDLIEHSDLSSGVYEGGFKIWECSIDLINFLKSSNVDVKDEDVLELGCGGGLPGIFCLLNGASSVCLQDFNEEVIDYFTIPNLFINVEKYNDSKLNRSEILDLINYRTMLLSGDWNGVHTLLKTENKQYDMILSSETIYNTKNYPIFHDLICSCLRKGGYGLLANKSYYFGVGGSSKDFVEYVEKQGKLQCKIVHQITDGVNRDILKLSWK